MRYYLFWSSWDGEDFQWLDTPGEVTAFMVEHGRRYRGATKWLQRTLRN